MALYVRDMFPSMMGIFVSRGKREVKSHLPGYEAPAPPAPPVPMPDVADIRRKMGDGIGLARGVAGGGIGLARDMTGTALQGLMAFRNLAAQAAAEDQATTTWQPDPSTAVGRVHRSGNRAGRRPRRGGGCARGHQARAGGRRPSDTRLRRAVGVTGDRTPRRPRRRFPRSDPRVRGEPPRTQHDPRQDRSAQLTWKPAGPPASTTSRGSSNLRT